MPLVSAFRYSWRLEMHCLSAGTHEWQPPRTWARKMAAKLRASAGGVGAGGH